jgi:PilZ domain
VTLDGDASFLVDLSTLGAQVLSPTALRPSRVVRMTLIVGESTLACKGRVVWASLERPNGTATAQYRAGLQFTETDPPLVDAFLVGQGLTKETSGWNPSPLEGTALSS